MPEPLTLVRSKSLSVKPHSRVTARTWDANASFSSIRSTSDSLTPARSRAFAVAGTGPIPMVFGGTPATPHDTSRASGRSPSSAAFSGVVTIAIAAPSFCPLALPAVTVASGSSLPMIGRSLARVSTFESGRMCSSRSTTVSPFRPLTVTGPISSANRPASTAAAARQAVLQEHARTGLDPPPHRGRVEGRVAHRLGATGQDEVGHAGLHLHGRVQDRLQAGTAAAVDLDAGRGDRQPRVERGHPADRGRLHRGVAVAEDHVLDRLRRQTGALDERADHRRGELLDRHVPQRSTEAPDRGPQRLADDRISHGGPPCFLHDRARPVRWEGRTRVSPGAGRPARAARSAGQGEPEDEAATRTASWCRRPARP